MNIVELFLNAAKQFPDNTAIIDKNAAISYSQLEKEVLETAAYFRKKGIQKGDRVLVFIPMGIDLYRIVLALFYIGATAVFLDEWVNKKRMEMCCEIAECKGFIGVFKARVFAFFSKELREIPIKLGVKYSRIGTIEMSSVNSDDCALITFTTGSTGRPKAAKRTHGFLQEQFNALLEEINPKVEDVDMPVLPIVLFMNLGVGCTSVIADFSSAKPDKMDVPKILEQMKENKVNRITASPFFITNMSEYAKNNSIKIQNISKLFTGGAPVFPKQARLYKEVFTDTAIKVVYGSTEVEPISSTLVDELINHSLRPEQGLYVGKPYHKTEVLIIQIIDAPLSQLTKSELEAHTMEDGELGEIIVSGPHVLKEYYNSEEAFIANKIVVDGVVWHRTGDSGRLINGELFLNGRCEQLIEHNGETISPFIIENQLQEIDGIGSGTLLKIDDKIILVIELDWVDDYLESKTKHIPHDEISFVPIMPRDPRHHSKIDYKMLELFIRKSMESQH